MQFGNPVILPDIQSRTHNMLTGGDTSLQLRHTLRIGGEDFTDRLRTANVTYNTDVGGSGGEFVVGNCDLEEYRDAPVQFWLGYDDDLMIPYFVGRLVKPEFDSNLYVSKFQAFGPFRLMVDQMLGSTETFVHKSLEYVIMECARRAMYSPGTVEVRNGRKFTVPPGELFTFENTLADVVTSLMEKAQFVGMDMPGGRRLFLPIPRPGATSAIQAVYDESSYKSFTISSKVEVGYSKVIVYRRDDMGNFVVYAEQKVGHTSRYNPPNLRAYIIADFPGNGFEAQDTAMRRSLLLRNGDRGFAMECPINPAFMLYDGFRGIEMRNLPGGRREERVYNCTIDGSMSLQYSGGEGSMSLEGTANEVLTKRRIIEPDERPIALSRNIIRERDEGNTWNTWGDDGFFFEDVLETYEQMERG